MAWLHAVPKPPERLKAKEESRLGKLKKAGREARLPEVTCTYLSTIFFELGPTQAGGLGAAVISEQEIRAWQDNRGITLQPWEISMLRRLSNAWIAEGHRAEHPDARAPWEGEVTPEEMMAVAGNLRDVLKGMAS